MPKILFITVRSDFGGGPRHVDQLVKLLDNNFELYMAYPENGEPYGLEWEKNERIIDIFHIPYRKFSLYTLFGLLRFTKKNHIDIVHSHGNGAGLYSRFLKLMMPQVKVVHTFHGISDEYSSVFKLVASYIIGWILEPLANIYICVSEGERKMALKRHFSTKNNSIVIYNGIKPPKTRIRMNMGQTIQIATISRFDYQKNTEMTICIAKKVKDLNLKFIIIGDGENRMKLEKEAKDNGLNIEFTGFLYDPMEHLNDVDWYISTSRFEGLPYALIEAASMGIPILATDVKGNNEVVVQNETGFLFKTVKEAELLIRHIADRNLDYEQLSNNSRAFFMKNFTTNKMIDKLTSIYHSL